jgi:TolA-binding protein
MFDEVNFKKFFIIVAVLSAAVWYVTKYYDVQDALKYAQEHRDLGKEPKVEFYIGSLYYLRSDYPHAIEALLPMLQAYPTCQYAPKALLRLGNSYQYSQKWDGAREAFNIYLQYFPKGPEIEAVKAKMEIIKFKGDSTETTNNLGDIYGAIEMPE